MDEAKLVDDLRTLLVDLFPQKKGLDAVAADRNLQDAGIDSMDTMTLMSAVEERFAVKFERFEGSYFDMLGRIAGLIAEKAA